MVAVLSMADPLATCATSGGKVVYGLYVWYSTICTSCTSVHHPHIRTARTYQYVSRRAPYAYIRLCMGPYHLIVFCIASRPLHTVQCSRYIIIEYESKRKYYMTRRDNFYAVCVTLLAICTSRASFQDTGEALLHKLAMTCIATPDTIDLGITKSSVGLLAWQLLRVN